MQTRNYEVNNPAAAESECSRWNNFRHPQSGARLTFVPVEAAGEITGYLTASGDRFPVVRGIPRFCPPDNYAASFGYQWQTFYSTQLDSRASWGNESQRRLFEQTGWSRDLEGQRVLEAGSGMGRFTEVLAKTGATCCTFDYSAAIDANHRNNGSFSNVSFAQGDIYAPPYEMGSFDKVLCIGVLQHCPSPRKAFYSLARFLKPGGEIVVDCYRLDWKCPFLGKYYLRPLTRRMSPPLLHALVKRHVAWVYPLTGFVQRIVGRPGRSLSWALSMVDYRGVYAMDDQSLRTLSELDTFDMLAPRYDRPQTITAIKGWLREAGLINTSVTPGYNGIVARGMKPAR